MDLGNREPEVGGRRLRILHVELVSSETSAPYNEHCLPLLEERDLAICNYYPATIDPDPRVDFFEGDGTLLGFVRVLSRALRSNSFDVIHLHTPHVGLIFVLLFGWQSHYRRRSIATIHNGYRNFRLRNRLMLIPIFACVERVVCCSRSSLESFPWFYRRLGGRRLAAVPNGLDIGRVTRTESPSSSRTDEFSVLSVGRLVRIKNPETLVDAFLQADNDQSRLLFLGDGDLRERLQEKARNRPIHFLGLIPRDETLARLSAADLFVSTSYGEGLPVATLEAMASGCPVVLSDIGPHREIAEGCNFIPLVPSDDAAGFAREISTFRAMTSEERQGVGKRCRDLVQSRFSLEAMHKGYSKVYSSLSFNQEDGSVGV